MKKMLAPSLIVSFLALILVFTWGSSVVRAADGKVVYYRSCAPCHGATGRGDGRGAALFQPKPQNFTDPAFWQGNVDQKISRNVMGFGKKMGKMDLVPDEITAVTAYITQQFKPAALPGQAEKATPPVPQTTPPAMTKQEQTKIGYVGPIEKATLNNSYFRQVLFTGNHSQLVVMCLQPGEAIGKEMHANVDQFFRIENGNAKFIFNEKEEHLVGDGDAVVVPAGTYHNVINMSSVKPLKLYTIYSPPVHPDGTVHKTKAEAEAAEHH